MQYKQAYQSDYKGGCGPRRGFGGHWGRGKFGGWWGRHMGGNAPVNIEETDETYIISLFAAGLVKEHVTLKVKDDVLTISYPGTAASADTDQRSSGNYTHQEYSQGAFERQFRLNNKILTENISATYADGVLKVVLPKNPETNKPAQTISVA